MKSTRTTLAAASMLIVAMALFTCVQSAVGFPSCEPCPDNICVDPEECRYGLAKDHCGRIICARAPDERCGGMFNFWGTCGAGLVCQCGRCVGCSTDTMQCSVHKNGLPTQDQATTC